MAKRSGNRVITSLALSVENADYIKVEKRNVSADVNKMYDAMRTGIYDENREAMMEALWQRFKNLSVWPHARTVEMVRSWLSSPGWTDELRSVGMSPQGFFAYVKRRVETEPDMPIELRIAVGLVKVPPYTPPSDAQLAAEKEQFMAQAKASKGIHVVRDADDARPLTKEEKELYGDGSIGQGEGDADGHDGDGPGEKPRGAVQVR